MVKRILIFSLAYFPAEGGAEIAIQEITDRVSDMEFDMITMRFDRSHKRQERIGNVNVYRVGSGSSYINKILFVPRAAALAIKLNRNKRYDLFWSMMTNMLFPVVLARMFGNRTPYVLTLQDGDPFEHVFKRLRIRVFMPLLKYGFRNARVVQPISNFLAEWARTIGIRGRLEVIPNGVDVNKFKVQSSKFKVGDKITLITTSRLVKKNGVGDIIESLKYLPENVHLKILGTGPLEIDCKLKIENWKLSDRVEMLGHVDYDEIPKYLHNSDVFIRPSLSEGFGSSFIEAMATGLPVIATPVGGIPGFLENGSTGLFCEPHNPESIAEQVNKLMNDESLRDKITTNALKMVQERYDWSKIAREMKEKVFNTV